MQLFQAIDEMQKSFNLPLYTSDAIKARILDHLVVIIKMYKDPIQIIPILENIDIEGQDCFYYITKYQLYRLLETKIMNQYIIDKWFGGLDFNSSIMNMATSYSLFVNHNEVYSTDGIFEKLFTQITTLNKSNKEHVARF